MVTSVWKTAQSGNWGTAANWNNSIVPDAADAVATFNVLGAANALWTVDLQGTTRTVGILNMTNNAAQSYLIQNGTLVMKTNSLVRGATADIVVQGTAATLNSLLGGLLTLQLDSDTNINVVGSSVALDCLAKVSGSGTLIKTGLGALNLYNAVSDWTGGLSIKAGSVVTESADRLAGNDVNISAGATLDLHGTTSQTIGTLTGAGTVTSTAGGTSTLDETNNTDAAFSGTISNGAGTVALTKNGSGKLTLNGANTFSGGLVVNAGTVESNNASGFGQNGILLAGSSGVRTTADMALGIIVNCAGLSNTIAAAAGTTLTLQFGFRLTFGPVNKSVHFGTAIDTGTIEFPASGIFSTSGAYAPWLLAIDGGTFKASGALDFYSNGANVQIASGANFDLNGSSVSARSLAGGGAITNSAAGAATILVTQKVDTTFAGSIVDGAGAVNVVLNAAAGATMGLSGANTYSGGTSILGGNLKTFAANALSANSIVSFSNASSTLDLNGFDQQVAALNSSGSPGLVTNSGLSKLATLTLGDSAIRTFSGVISDGAGTTALTKVGTGVQNLNGANTYSGATQINAGTLQILGSGSIANSSGVLVAAGAVLAIGGLGGASAIQTLSNAGQVSVLARKLSIGLQAGDLVGDYRGSAAGSGASSGLVVNIANIANFSMGAATFTEWSAADTIDINGNSFANVITGSSQADRIAGAAGVDTLDGGGGNDTLVGGAAAAGQFNQLNGGAGLDCASYEGTVASVYADLNTQAGIVGGVLTDLYTSIEGAIGGDGADTLNGDALDNRFSGGLGDDLLFGNNGNDTLTGGGHAAQSFNQLFGGAGSDTVDYSAETGKIFVDLRAPAGHIDSGSGFVLNDLMNSIENAVGGSNDDILVGTDTDNNLLVGNGGTDVLFGFAGDDTLIGGSANFGQYNQLWGGLGFDTASYGGTTNKVYADLNVLAGWVDDGNGTLVLTDVYNSIENLAGGSAADSLVGDAGANVIEGGGGADILYGNIGVISDNSIDRFVYRSAVDSNLTTGYDTIRNFRTAQDVLDFSAFGINASKVLINSSNGSTSVYADVDGVAGFGANDLAIAVIGTNAVAMGDILF